jgi:GTP-binding protein EngB required for normal cell division
MNRFIPVLTRLQDVLGTIGAQALDLPQVVVIGGQGSGKSSVLEAIIGKPFLPRGAGICTRRPLIIQLIHVNEGGSPREWGEFLHVLDKRWTDFREIRQEIEEETDRSCGTNNSVGNKPINLQVYSPEVLNLTVVDLPGLIKGAVEGCPTDAAFQIEQMVMSYIAPENAIILAIIRANQDIKHSDSIITARKVDPDGNRTLGVVTKLDLMDMGTNARDLLLNRIDPLKLGYIGVVNRSQRNIQENVSLLTASVAEHKFFKNSQAYQDISDNCGTDFLVLKLNRLFLRQVQSKLPGLYAQINDLLAIKIRELSTYGESLGQTAEDQEMVIFRLVNGYMEEFVELLDGTSDELSWQRLDGGSAMISAR